MLASIHLDWCAKEMVEPLQEEALEEALEDGSTARPATATASAPPCGSSTILSLHGPCSTSFSLAQKQNHVQNHVQHDHVLHRPRFGGACKDSSPASCSTVPYLTKGSKNIM